MTEHRLCARCCWLFDTPHKFINTVWDTHCARINFDLKPSSIKHRLYFCFIVKWKRLRLFQTPKKGFSFRMEEMIDSGLLKPTDTELYHRNCCVLYFSAFCRCSLGVLRLKSLSWSNTSSRYTKPMMISTKAVEGSTSQCLEEWKIHDLFVYFLDCGAGMMMHCKSHLTLQTHRTSPPNLRSWHIDIDSIMFILPFEHLLSSDL